MRKKIKADSVDELFEIVKAVQNGEEPEDYSRRKAERERAAEEERRAAREKARAQKAERKEKAAQQRSKQAAEASRPGKEAPEETLREAAAPGEGQLSAERREKEPQQRINAGDAKDEFERLLEEEQDDSIAKNAAAILGRLRSAGDFLKRSAAGAGTKSEKQPIEEKPIEEKPKEPRAREPKTERDATESGKSGKTVRQYGKSVSEEAQTVGKRILRSLHMEPEEEKHETAGADEPKYGTAGADEPKGSTVDPETIRRLDHLLDAKAVAAGRPGQTRRIGSLVESEREAEEPAEERVPGVRGNMQRLLARLADKGIQRRELTMLGTGAVLLLLIVVMIVRAVLSSAELKRKQEHVTAAEGLTVTVEKQPTEWCGAGEVQLKFSVKGGTIASVEINGTTYEADRQGIVTLEAQDYLLEASVITDSGTLSAEIEIPYVDTDPPTVYASESGAQIVLTASDSRSGVAAIWYAAVQGTAYLQLPKYQEYTEPITYEENTTYYFYAIDNAGNRSTPIVFDMPE